MKKMQLFVCALGMAIVLVGCAACSSDEMDSVEKAEAEYADQLTKTVGIDGLMFKIMPSWDSVKADDNIVVRPSYGSLITASTYLNGETRSLEQYEKLTSEFRGSWSDYVVVEDWWEADVHYILYEHDQTDDAVAPEKIDYLLGCDEKGKGFAIYFVRDDTSITYPFPDLLLDVILSTVVFDPGIVTGKAERAQEDYFNNTDVTVAGRVVEIKEYSFTIEGEAFSFLCLPADYDILAQLKEGESVDVSGSVVAVSDDRVTLGGSEIVKQK